MPHLSLIDDPAVFRARAQAHLLAAEAENNLILGITSGIERGVYAERLFAVLEDDGVLAAAVMTPPHRLAISFCAPHDAAAFAGALHAHGVALPGVNGTIPAVDAFADAWASASGTCAERVHALRIMSLRKVEMPTGVVGALRLASGPDDLNALTAWISAFEIEALGEGGDPGAVRERVERTMAAAPASGHWIWEVDGEPVSTALHGGMTPNGVRISGVYTPPPLRAHGYASACVAALSARMLADGRRFCFLYTDATNPTSNKIYEAIGYRFVADAADHRFIAPP